jgi:glycerol-3-phosphate dehydrogenase (NAD(P)+)
MPGMDREALLSRARTRGVSPLVYWCVRAVLQPFFHVWFRLSRIGREHIPATGPAIIASNHRSFLDPFVIAVMARRPIYFVAKKELFLFHPAVSWLLSALGAFPIDRGASDQESMATARAILARGDIVLMFPEGTRIRPGALGRPKRGVGRLALETGAPVVPVAIIGTEAVRRGWRIRPHKVRIRAGRALTFPRVERPSPALAGAVTDRIWPCVELQWEWLGGVPRLRRAAVVGAGARGTALAVALARAGLEVDLGTGSADAAARIGGAGANEQELPGVPLPDGVNVVRAADLELDHHDLVAFAVPPLQLPEAVTALGPRIPARAGLVVAGGDATRARYVAERVRSRAVALVATGADAAAALAGGAPAVVASADAGFLTQVADALHAAGLAVTRTRDLDDARLVSLPTIAPRRSRAA